MRMLGVKYHRLGRFDAGYFKKVVWKRKSSFQTTCIILYYIVKSTGNLDKVTVAQNIDSRWMVCQRLKKTDETY